MSVRPKAGLANYIAISQRVILLSSKPINKLTVRGIKDFALTSSKVSHGYLIYAPSLHKIVDTINYVIVKNDIPVANNETYDEGIFDPLHEFITKDWSVYPR